MSLFSTTGAGGGTMMHVYSPQTGRNAVKRQKTTWQLGKKRTDGVLLF